jgi:hypothetical protein
VTEDTKSKIKDWLDHRRSYFRDVVTQGGMSDNLSMEFPTVQFDDNGGWNLADVSKRVSVFEDSTACRKIVDQAGVIFDVQGEQVARDLAQDFSDAQINWGYGVVASPLLRETLSVSAPRISKLRHLLMAMLFGYLRGLPSLAVGNEQLAQRLVDELLAFLQPDTMTLLVAIPIGGVELEKPRLGHMKIQVRTLDPDEAGALVETPKWRPFLGLGKLRPMPRES